MLKENRHILAPYMACALFFRLRTARSLRGCVWHPWTPKAVWEWDIEQGSLEERKVHEDLKKQKEQQRA